MATLNNIYTGDDCNDLEGNNPDYDACEDCAGCPSCRIDEDFEAAPTTIPAPTPALSVVEMEGMLAQLKWGKEIITQRIADLERMIEAS